MTDSGYVPRIVVDEADRLTRDRSTGREVEFAREPDQFAETQGRKIPHDKVDALFGLCDLAVRLKFLVGSPFAHAGGGRLAKLLADLVTRLEFAQVLPAAGEISGTAGTREYGNCEDETRIPHVNPDAGCGR